MAAKNRSDRELIHSLQIALQQLGEDVRRVQKAQQASIYKLEQAVEILKQITPYFSPKRDKNGGV